MYLIGLLIHLEKLLQFFGSVTSSSLANADAAPDTDTIAGETTSNNDGNSSPSTNIDVVGLAVFKGDVLVRRINCN